MTTASFGLNIVRNHIELWVCTIPLLGCLHQSMNSKNSNSNSITKIHLINVRRKSLSKLFIHCLEAKRCLESWANLANVMPYISGLVWRQNEYTLWQCGLWSFQTGGTKLEIFLPKNQHTQSKLLNFENWVSGEVSKKPNLLTFKVNFLYQKLSESFSTFFSLKNINLGAHLVNDIFW